MEGSFEKILGTQKNSGNYGTHRKERLEKSSNLEKLEATHQHLKQIGDSHIVCLAPDIKICYLKEFENSDRQMIVSEIGHRNVKSSCPTSNI